MGRAALTRRYSEMPKVSQCCREARMVARRRPCSRRGARFRFHGFIRCKSGLAGRKLKPKMAGRAAAGLLRAASVIFQRQIIPTGAMRDVPVRAVDADERGRGVFCGVGCREGQGRSPFAGAGCRAWQDGSGLAGSGYGRAEKRSPFPGGGYPHPQKRRGFSQHLIRTASAHCALALRNRPASQNLSA